MYSEGVVDGVFRLFQVIFEYAIVEPYYESDNVTYNMRHTYVSLRLSTLVPIGNSTMIVPRRNGIRYLPDNYDHELLGIIGSVSY